MKKRPPVLLVILGLIIAFIVGLFFLLFGNQATTPDAISKKVGLKLPAYQITKAEDNMADIRKDIMDICPTYQPKGM